MSGNPESTIRTINFPGGQRYEGEMQNGKMHGKGKMISPDGTRYEGDWINGLPHGFGTMTWPGGFVETGRWEKGIFKG